MPNPLTASAREFAEAYVPEDRVIQVARSVAQEVGLVPIQPGAGAARRPLARPGGVLAVSGALAGGRIADPAARDPQTVVHRELVKALREADEWLPALLPVGDGLLAAVKR